MQSLSKMLSLTNPVSETMHAANLPNSKTLGVIMTRSTEGTHAIVATAVLRLDNGSIQVNTAVQYEAGGTWYSKESYGFITAKLALKRAYGINRKHYKVTASRSFAGLLHDSVVPATEDIDF